MIEEGYAFPGGLMVGKISMSSHTVYMNLYSDVKMTHPP